MKSAEPKAAGPTNTRPGTFFQAMTEREGGLGATEVVQRTPAFETEADAAPGPLVQRSAQRGGFFGARGTGPERPGFFPSVVQTKLEVSSPDDPLEREAESTADRVMRRIAGGAAGDADSIGSGISSLQRAAEPSARSSQLDSVVDGTEVLQTDSASGGGAASGGEGAESGSSLEGQLAASSGGGSPLPNESRGTMESAFQSDFSDVRVHDDSNAASMNRSLQANAFTHGSDIYFNEGRYAPGTSDGDRLLAHELTHVVQQGGGAQPQRIDREGEDTVAPPIDPATLPLATGRPDPTTETITFSEIDIPRFKMAAHRGALYNAHKPLKRRKAYDRGNPGQRDKWRNNFDTTAIREDLEEKIKRAQNVETVDPSASYVFEVPVAGNGARPFMFGNIETLARSLTTPMWGGRQRRPPLRFFDVDHIVELQLADWQGVNTSWPNEFGNMELLESSINQGSGRDIRANIISKVNDFLGATGTQFGTGVADIKSRYHLHFETPVPRGGTSSATATQFWTKDAIEAGEHLVSVRAADPSALGRAGRVRVFSNPAGGLGKGFNWPGGLDASEADWMKPFKIVEKHFVTEGEGVENTPMFGHLTIEMPAEDEVWEPMEGGRRQIDVHRVTGARYAGWVQKSTLRPHLMGLKKKALSPIRVDTFDLLPDRGIYVAGAVLPTLPLLGGTGIQFELSEGALRLRKEFVGEELTVPPPFSIRSTSLVLFADTSVGLGAEGRIDFGIDRVGEGHIAAAASTSGGLSLAGAFNFDTELFSRAEVAAAYSEGAWSFSGTLGIDAGTITGVDSAEITVSYENETLTANGTASLSVPGVESGALNMELGPAGFTLGGEFQLSSDIPGIESGSVNATLSRSAETGQWGIVAGGSAVPSIPGIESSLSIEYDNGIITIGANAAYSRGILAGRVEFGATNRAVDGEGQPTGEASETLRAYGSGELTVTLTPWLAATIGVRFLENGEIVVQGRLALPDAVDVFDRREIRRNLFTAPTIEIPLFAIPLGPRSIGLVAQIGGGLDFEAGFGPGQLRDLAAEITYNPDHPDQTVVRGTGRFVVPADAGLVLRARLGVGASIGIASVTGGIEVAGTLGLEAEASAAVDVNWSPTGGIVLDAEANVTVSPKFTFDINAFVRASLDLWLVSFSETWRHNLVSFEWGPGLSFGLRFPIHYQQGVPFSLSFDDLEVTAPDIDVVEMAGDLARDIKDLII